MRNLIAAIICVLTAAGLTAGCGGPVSDIVGVDHPATPAAEVDGTVHRTVYVATTRKRADDDRRLFTAERDPDGLNLARVSVSVPPLRKPGRVSRPQRLPPDPKRTFLLLDPEVFAGEQAFTADLDATLARRPQNEREVLVFIHGYNTDLPAAIIRLAQIVEDTGFNGVPVVFAWPSRARAFQYAYDLNSALHARDELSQTVRLVASTRTTGMNFISHSMGNMLALEAMRQDQLTGAFNSHGKISAIAMTAPDIDVELFAKQLRVFPDERKNFYILISRDDQALSLSRQLAGGVNRVGLEDADDLAKLGVTVVDLTAVKNGDNDTHSKFAGSGELLMEIGGWLNEEDAYRESNPNTLSGRLPKNVRVVNGIND